jgi:CHAT domain-containing protein
LRARTLLDVIDTGKIDISKAMTAEERAKERGYKNELASLNTQIADAQNEDKRKEIAARLEQKRLQFQDFQARLYGSHPELKIQRGDVTPVDLRQAALLLPDSKSSIVEFMVGEDRTFGFVITKDTRGIASLKVFTVPLKRSALSLSVNSFREKLAKGSLDFQRESRNLYDLLIKPAETQLAGKTNLIIVPDGPLWDMPFQALQNASSKYLIGDSAIHYGPSVTALAEISKKRRKSGGELELLAFGNPVVSKRTSDLAGVTLSGDRLGPLPDTEVLTATLGQMYGPGRSKLLIGADASESSAKKESPKYRVVQFATHGVLNNVSPMYSHLVLSQNADNSNEDGLLEAWEMKDLDLKADMVILSACDTARGKISSGEGVIGMTWALFIAGTPTTVASQWKVDSASTTELMLEFHRQLLAKKRVSKAEALRRASLKVMKMPGYSHPSYWAAFVIVGDGS